MNIKDASKVFQAWKKGLSKPMRTWLEEARKTVGTLSPSYFNSPTRVKKVIKKRVRL